ncbi:unnamed protein product [Gadus morhua 'NCC']
MRSRTRGSKWSSSLRCGYDDMGNQFGIAHILCIVCVSERCVNKELRGVMLSEWPSLPTGRTPHLHGNGSQGPCLRSEGPSYAKRRPAPDHQDCSINPVSTPVVSRGGGD